MTECNTQIDEFEPWTYNPPRKQDFFLMDIVKRSGIPDAHKDIFNRVRINMSLITASDIVLVASPTKIIPSIYRGKHCRSSSLNWPTQQSLPAKWQEFFNHILDSVIKPQLANTRLGKWTSRGHQFCNYAINAISNTIVPITSRDEIKNNQKIDWDIDKQRVLGKLYIIPAEPLDNPIFSILNTIASVPPWLKKIWRCHQWELQPVRRILHLINTNNLCLIRDGTVRDQWAAQVYCLADKTTLESVHTVEAPVDGDPDHMKKIRAECTWTLSALSLLHTLKPFITAANIEMPIYTSCKGMINHVKLSHVNSPSLVLDDNIDIILQLRHVIQHLNISLQFHHINKPSEEHLDNASGPEKILFHMYRRALSYFRNATFQLPMRFPIAFPAQKYCLMYNAKPIVTNIAIFLQESERRGIREEYFTERMGILPDSLLQVDTYALSRVLQKTPKRKVMYSKIIHKQLNIMVINNKWRLGEATCPLCGNTKHGFIFCNVQLQLKQHIGNYV